MNAVLRLIKSLRLKTRKAGVNFPGLFDEEPKSAED
jgi:hypothetical protein